MKGLLSICLFLCICLSSVKATDPVYALWTGSNGTNTWLTAGNWVSNTGSPIPTLRIHSSRIPEPTSVNLTTTRRSTGPVFDFQTVIGGELVILPRSQLRLIPYKADGPCDAQLEVAAGDIGGVLLITLRSNSITPTNTKTSVSNFTSSPVVWVINKRTGKAVNVTLMPDPSSSNPSTFVGFLYTTQCKLPNTTNTTSPAPNATSPAPTNATSPVPTNATTAAPSTAAPTTTTMNSTTNSTNSTSTPPPAPAAAEICVDFGDEIAVSHLASSCFPTKVLSSSVFLSCGRYNSVPATTINVALLEASVQKHIAALSFLQNTLMDVQKKTQVDFNQLFRKIDMQMVAELTHQYSSTCLDDFLCAANAFVEQMGN
eukprot:TRINITY_DN1584_c0_g1_i1.p1 TRINITY_DN1584_c0_g1~~TRINITY_DN1584_c0_g1_i1.p1  ORF type:complete len:372 (-),score=138.71 TRINITY_DN1584_c0_g1_i1:173-1288(-)